MDDMINGLIFLHKYICYNLPHVAEAIGNILLQVAEKLECEETETPGKHILIYCDSFLSFPSVSRFPL
jgi:hypothetical protein